MHYVLRECCVHIYWGALNKSTFTQHYYQHLCIQKSHTHTYTHWQAGLSTKPTWGLGCPKQACIAYIPYLPVAPALAPKKFIEMLKQILCSKVDASRWRQADDVDDDDVVAVQHGADCGFGYVSNSDCGQWAERGRGTAWQAGKRTQWATRQSLPLPLPLLLPLPLSLPLSLLLLLRGS